MTKQRISNLRIGNTVTVIGYNDKLITGRVSDIVTADATDVETVRSTAFHSHSKPRIGHDLFILDFNGVKEIFLPKELFGNPHAAKRALARQARRVATAGVSTFEVV